MVTAEVCRAQISRKQCSGDVMRFVGDCAEPFDQEPGDEEEP